MNGLTSMRRATPALALAALGALAIGATSTAAAATTATASAVPACRTADFAAVVRNVQAGAGQRQATLVLRNRSSRSCHTFGYVGLQLRSARGGNIPTSTTRVRPPAPKTIVLTPGAHAFAKLAWTAVASGSESQSGACEPTAKTLQITPPDQTARVSTAWRGGPVCARGAFRVGALTR